MHSRAVRQTSIHDRPVLIDFTPYILRHIVDRGEECIFVGELGFGLLQTATSLDINLVRTVDHDFRHSLVIQKAANRTQEVTETGFKDRFARHVGDSTRRGGMPD